MVALLIDRGADVNLGDNLDFTPLFRACEVLSRLYFMLMNYRQIFAHFFAPNQQ